jgi:pimeloyl-ACP methyl ester carboxylesterase
VPVSAVTAISTASPAPLTGRPILSWAHGTPASLTDGCAPSRGAPGASYPLLLRDFLDGGYAVVATDYIGLGTPGVHPYLVGKSEASAVVSAARAAENFSPLQASGPVIIAGHSQGGHAALWADGMAQAPSYVSGLDVRGVIALAPPTDLVTIAKTGIDAQSPVLRNNINFLLAAGSWHLFYNLDYPPVLTDAGVGIADAGANPNTDECYVPDLSATGQWVQGGPLPDSWITALRENSPEPDAFPIPLLIVQGYVDQQVPFPVTLAAVDEYCEHGATITFRGIRTGNHLTPLTDTSEVAKEFEWAQQRIRGETPGNTCPSLLGLG